ncbi:hypothetical protein RhiLY_10496 [Ceratobasidium sp. AG-Ba]|nr:hypothetical protein RhiLY_10496 [Ceratobasidium sp. AG-Ba]
MIPPQVQAAVDINGGSRNCITLLKAHSKKSATLALRIMMQIYDKSLDVETTDVLLTKSNLSDYQDRLADALESKDLTRFMEYSPNDPNEHDPTTEIVKESDKYENYVADSFTRPYIGPAAELLFYHLQELDDSFSDGPRRYYAKMCSIVQSSGVGKSRAILQLKEHNVIVVYMNIRMSGRSEDGVPYPPRDDIPANILTKELECSEDEYSDRCIAFLSSLFTVLAKHLKHYSDQYHSRDQIVRAWSNEMCELKDTIHRTLFFQELEGHHVKELSQIGLARDRARQIELAKEKARQQRLEDTTEDPRKKTDKKKKATDRKDTNVAVDSDILPVTELTSSSSGEIQDGKSKRPVIFGVENLRNAFRRMLGSAKTIFIEGEHAPQLVLAFDEADPLCEQQEHFLPSHTMSRSISEVSRAERTSPVWTFFASTTSKVADFSAPAHLHTSARIYLQDKLLFPPYFNFGWDQNALSLSEINPKDVAKYANIVRFGRPLWKSLVESGGLSKEEALDLASQKLTNAVIFDPANRNQSLAVIGQRFLLNICLGEHNSTEILQDSISSHLRVCLGISPDRTLIETAYPSEPLLSCAAAVRLYPKGKIVTKKCLDIINIALTVVKTEVLSQTVTRGDKGEFTSRLVFLLSKDLATRRYQRQALPAPFALSSDELLDCKAVPVTVFLEHTFGPAKVTVETSTLLDGWYVNFSHWIATGENILFNGRPGKKKTQWKSWLLRNWTRTCAVQCAPLQRAFDKFIPMFNLGRLEKPRAPPFLELVSFILISDKAKKQGSGSTLNADWLKLANLPRLNQPYVTIVADLGLSSQEAVFTLDSSLANPVLKIHAPGIGRTTYPNLTDQLIEPLREILAEPIKEEPKRETYAEASERFNRQLRYGGTSKNADIVWENNKWSFSA